MRRKKYLEMEYHNSNNRNVFITDDKRKYDLRSLCPIVEEIILENQNNLFSDYIYFYDNDPDRKYPCINNYQDASIVFDSPEYVNQKKDFPTWLQKFILKYGYYHYNFDVKYRNIVLNELSECFPYDLNLEHWKVYDYGSCIYLFSYYEDEKPA